MRIRQNILLFLAAFLPLQGQAQTASPDVDPTATYIDENEVEAETGPDVEIKGNAPLVVQFRANPTNMEDYTPLYEWHFQKEGEETEMMVRYEEDTQFTFTETGKTLVTLKVKPGGEIDELPSKVFTVVIQESQLVFPNAFSPDGDSYNQTFKPKTCQSIVEFHAYIFNRWGQKLYDWTDPYAEGWDGTYNGKDVKEGVYFLLVKAKGADGRTYNIKKDVNLLRGYIQDATNQ